MATFHEAYSLGGVIGRGTYSTVHSVTRKSTGERFAAKFVDRTTPSFNPDEIVIAEALRHPNIVETVEVFYTATQAIIVMEQLEGGELFGIASASTGVREDLAAAYVFQLLSALSFLHENGIVHRDVKLENLVLISATQQVKLIDFGFSKRIGKERSLNSCCGSPNYMSPEMLRATRARDAASLPTKHGHYGCEVDIWAAGVAMYVLLFGQYPFFESRQSLWHKRILEGQYAIPTGTPVSCEALDLLSKLLDVNVSSRISSSAALNHNWFSVSNVGRPLAAASGASSVAFSTPKKRLANNAAAAAADPLPFTPPHNAHSLSLVESP